MTTVPTEPVLAALEQQVACYQRLAKLAELQHVYVQQGQTEQLLDVLGQRQTVLNELAVLERTVRPAKGAWAAFAAALPPDRRARAEAHLAETRRLLEQITAADRNDTLVLQQRQLTLGKQINQAAAARQVNRSYAAAAYGRPASNMNVRR